MGGPDSLEAIRPFLYNLFSDHEIIRIPRLIQKPVAWLIAKNRAEKTKEYYIKMGGKSPQKEQTFQQAEELQKRVGDGFVVTVGMRYWHPFIEEAVEKLLEENVHHNHPLFIKAWVEKIKQDLEEKYTDFYLLFSAHSLPEKLIKEGDPYKDQIEETVKLAEEVGITEYKRVGTLRNQPYFIEALKDLILKEV